MILRPTQLDHPTFTGSNRNPSGHVFGFDPVNGPWDVDNDGNGVEDSIWIDMGMPVQATSEGGLVKPLFAILCIDLDGRLNLNAHSSMSHIQPEYLNPTAPFPTMADFPAVANSATSVAGGPTSADVEVLRSEGYGPADAYLGLAFELDSGFQQTEFEDFIQRRYTGYDEPKSGVFGPGRPGFPDSTLGLLPSTPPFGYEFYGATNDYAKELSSYGSPPDFHGLSAIALDHAGQPLIVHLNLDLNLNFPASSLIDNPYETNLVDANGQDGLVGPADLAGLLRSGDFDSYSQLEAYSAFVPDPNTNPTTADIAASHRNRNIVTHASFDIPMPRIPGDPLQQFTAWSYSPADEAEVYPTEMLFGQKMNINRVFGDGDLDTVWTTAAHNRVVTGNRVVDEANEIERLRTTNASEYQRWRNDVPFDSPNPQYPLRQAYARHLYCLLMATTYDPANPANPTTMDLDSDGNPDTPQDVAQWCVNVVDFRDADSIMTPFEFDTNLTNGWNVDGDLATTGDPDRGVVWGCERPELLLTEALATHDRRTEDLAMDSSGKNNHILMPAPPAEPDPHFDQRLRPMGALFVELYNPWTSTVHTATTAGKTTKPPYELYDPFIRGVMLNAVNEFSSPVWRFVIVKGRSQEADLNRPTLGMPAPANNFVWGTNPNNFDPTDVDRVVYMASPLEANLASITDLGLPPDAVFHPRDALKTSFSSIAPGRYAVIGPGDRSGSAFYDSTAGTYTSPFGRTTANATTDGPASFGNSIQLSPSNDLDTSQVQVNGNSITPPKPAAVAFVVDEVGTDPANFKAVRLSISEPRGGYANVVTDVVTGTDSNWDSAGAAGEGEYDIPADEPFDWDRPDLRDSDFYNSDELLRATRTMRGFRTVFLQRLANPLRAWNADTNPFITIDSIPVDLNVFNGVEEDVLPDASEIDFSTVERGFATTTDRLLWKHESPKVGIAGNSIPDPQFVFPFVLQHSLGLLNQAYGTARPDGLPDTATNEAFPWLNFPNRPFANLMELQLVPRSAPSRLLHDFGVTGSSFGHLPNLTQRFDPTNAPADISKFFEYLEVPSRYRGTRRWYDDREFNPTADNASPYYSYGLKYPFHSVSRFRDPGRVNINTINDPRTWNAISGVFQVSGNSPAFWELVDTSRRHSSFDPTNPTTTHLDPTVPSQFAEPFRSPASQPFTPSSMTSSLSNGSTADLLRLNAAGTGPLLGFQWSGKYANTARNPYFRTQIINRLSSVTTTTSNVFAVWVTVGYFEVQPFDPDGDGVANVDAAHPDGYASSSEFGSETGQVERNRAFYIIDRSIPVGFEPGEEHNANQAIVLEQFIE